MRDLAFYETIDEYREAIRGKFDPLFLENDFYSNLIDWIVDHRAPIFYTISHPSEHFAFSGAYQFETERERYPNVFRRNLFWLHDFTHMMFPFSHDLFYTSECGFIKEFTYQERIASTETEVFAYYRVPGLREQVFPDEKLYYDVMIERGMYGQYAHTRSAASKPRAAEFLEHRNHLVCDDDYGHRELIDTQWDGNSYPEILTFFQQWRNLTPKWCSERYLSMVGKRIPDPERRLIRCNVEGYESEIELYHWQGTQENYETTTLDNIRRAYAMLALEHPPTKWRHVPEALTNLEGAVFFQ